MATAVIMPRQGQSVESCLIGRWYKNKGDKVSAGDLLFTYETDKATFRKNQRLMALCSKFSSKKATMLSAW